MFDYASIAAVAAVVREGTFERAAVALRVTPSAVSQRVRGLEERLGSILIRRGQPCEATELGRKLCAHYDQVRLLEHDLDPELGRAARHAAVPPVLTIAVNADSLATWFHAALAAFGRQGDVSLDLKLDDEAHTAERLRSGEVLAAVSADADPVQGCRTTRLGALRYAACASPEFIIRHFDAGVNGARLARAPYLQFDRRDGLQARWAREAYGTELAAPVFWVPSTYAFLDLTLSGLGWSLHPVPMVEAHIEAGRLVELPPGLRIDVMLYWTVARLHSGALRGLTQAVKGVASRELGGS
ncbi:LysR family transcriptional regulator ArgP [Sphingomonas bacterium]|uniref:LysR family transcriptional regulator ArgP n=1 Tax=Sphingomonas bacterium TaxID=1895847 RepID=UPI001575E9FC|nr:LysR family transcriptional regulator ArgP [Sphingomonas bacterium]